MSKNTSSNAFRRIDVDQYAEDNYKVSYNCSGSFLVNEFWPPLSPLLSIKISIYLFIII